MPRTKTTPFKTALTEHVHIVTDTKGRKVPAISVLWTPDAYSTIIHNTYKNKSNDAEFCILFATYIHHHIESETQKLAVNEGFSKNDTRVISKNIRHAPAIMEFFEEYEQHGKAERKTMTVTIFDNHRNVENSGFLTLTFNGGVDKADMSEMGDNMQYLHVVNGLSPTTPSTGSSLVKSFPQTEFVFLEEDVDRYMTFIKDVAIYYNYLQEFNREASSAKAVLKSSLKQRSDVMNKRMQMWSAAKSDSSDSQSSAVKKSEKRAKGVKKTGESAGSLTAQSSNVKESEKKKKSNDKKRHASETSKDDIDLKIQKSDSIAEKKRKLNSLASVIENKKKEITDKIAEKNGKKVVKKKTTAKTMGVIKEVIKIGDDASSQGKDDIEEDGDEYEGDEEIMEDEELEGDREEQEEVDPSSSECEEEGEDED